MLDLVLEFAHHLAVFSLVGVIAAEFALIAPGLAGARLRRAGLLDSSHGILAGLIVIVGFARVFFGEAGSAFYLGNPVFGLWEALGAGVLGSYRHHVRMMQCQHSGFRALHT